MKKDEIIQILIDWNFWGNYREESIKRPEYLNKLKALLKTGEIVVVKGVRRSGKSTLLAQFISQVTNRGEKPGNTLIINLEDPRFQSLDLKLLIQIYEVYQEEMLPDVHHIVILDEVQEVDGWEKFARYLMEAKKVTVLITGSSAKLLSSEYATLLSGRHVDMDIYPLSFSEFIRFNGLEIKDNVELLKKHHKIKNLLSEYLEWGGFPKIALLEKTERRFVLESYFRDILIKDVQKRFAVREVGKLEDLAKFYLTNMATVQSFNKVKNVVKLSLDSVERFSSYFSIAVLFYLVPKFSWSVKDQILNPKKVYCVDTGLRNIVSFRFSRDAGRLMENSVFLELKRRGFDVFYWKSPRQREIDFVVMKDGNIEQLIQVCFDVEEEKTRTREIKGLMDGVKELFCSNLLVITDRMEDEEKWKNNRIHFIPLWKWLLT